MLGNVKWSVVPFITVCVTITAYVALSFVRLSPNLTMIPIWIEVGLFSLLLLVSTASLIPRVIDTKFCKSSILIWIVIFFRLLGLILVIIPKTKLQILMVTAELVPFALNFWILFLTSQAYFGTALMSRDPKNYVHDKQATEMEDERITLLEKRLPQRKGLQEAEMACLCTITVVVAIPIVRSFLPTALTSPGSVLTVISQISEWTFLMGGVVYVLIKISQMRSLSHKAAFFSKSHSNGFAWFLLLAGWSLRLSIAVVYKVQREIKPGTNFSDEVFITATREMFTQLLPFFFHLFNIFQQKLYSKYQSKAIDPALRIRIFCYVMVSVMHLFAIGYVLEHGQCMSPTDEPGTYHQLSPRLPRSSFLAVTARAAGFVASMDLCFVAMAFIAPFIQFLNHFFNIRHHSVHKLRFHKNVALSACIFSFIHIALHIINWTMNEDHNSIGCGTIVDSTVYSNTTHPPKDLYSTSNTDFITGVVMAACFLGAMITGILMTWRAHAAVFSSHAPFAILGFIALFIHGRDNILGDQLGSQLCEAVFIISVITFVLFFLFARAHELEVDQRRTKFSNSFVLLSLKYNDSSYVPPGSFFNIYASTDSYMSIFHGHSFSVFSTQDSRIVFLIQCKTEFGGKHGSSFTSRLVHDKPSNLRVQGPFQGLASSFLLSLSSVPNNGVPKCIFLCGWNSGIASVFSLLQYIKDNAQAHNIQSMTCMFSRIDAVLVREEVHRCIELLVHEWFWEIPLTIIESQDLDELSRMTDNHDRLLAEGMDKSKWRQVFPHSEIWFVERNRDGIKVGTRSSITDSRVLYFCGEHFRHELFPEPKWQTFVESS